MNENGLTISCSVIAIAMATALSTSAHAGDVADVVRDLYTENDGARGIQLTVATGNPAIDSHTAHFTDSSAAVFDSLSEQVSSSTAVLSVNAASTSVTFDVATGVPVRRQESLGPLISERATTLGMGKLNFGFSFTHISYDELNGDDTGSLGFSLGHIDCCTIAPDGTFISPVPDGQVANGFENDIFSIALDLDIEQDVFAFFGTYGVTDTIDVGAFVPVIRAEAKANALATINSTTLGPGGPDVHAFDIGNPAADQPGSRVDREATSLGDVLLRGKMQFMKGEESLPDLAVLGTIQLPTGSDEDLAGTGELGLEGMIIASKSIGAFTPHANLGYLHIFDDDFENQIKLAVGADAQVAEKVTIAADLLGRIEPQGDTDRIDLSAGVKWNVADNAIISGNVILPLNDEGLRADYIYTLSVDYTF